MRVLSRISRTMNVSGVLILLGFFFIPAQSLLWAENVPVSMQVLGVTVLAVTFFRPTDGLLIVAALGPLGVTLGRILGSPARGSEALILAFLAGWLLRSFRRIDGTKRELGNLFVPVLLFGFVVVTSGIEQLIVLQVQRDYPWPFLQALSVFFARDYLLGPGGFGFVQTALRLLEGLALFVCTASICRADRTIAPRVIRALIAGGVGAALLSVTFVAIDAIQTGDWTAALFISLQERWSVHIGDMNAAGSYFILISAIGLGAGLRGTRWSVVWLVASLTSFVGLWLTGSVTAILSSLLLLGATGVWLAVTYFRSMTGRRIGTLTLFATVTITILVILYSPLVLNQESLDTLNIRRLFFMTTLGMVVSRPIFGVGVGGYSLWSAHFSPPELLEIYYRNNAHNYFLQIAGELGLVGLAVFGWVLFASLRSAWPGTYGIRRDPLQFGLIAGVVAFLLTCLTGHPLLIPEVIYPFWIALGLAVGAANSDVGPGPQADSARLSREVRAPGRRWLVASMVAFLFFSIPARVAREVRELDLTRITYGFHAWEEDQSGTSFRWTRRRARLHIAGEARFVDIPLRALIEAPGHPLDVNIFLDGRPSVRVSLVDNSWQQARVEIPRDKELLVRQVELLVNRTFVPRDSIPGSTDSRELGVQVGEVAVAGERRATTP